MEEKKKKRCAWEGLSWSLTTLETISSERIWSKFASTTNLDLTCFAPTSKFVGEKKTKVLQLICRREEWLRSFEDDDERVNRASSLIFHSEHNTFVEHWIQFDKEKDKCLGESNVRWELFSSSSSFHSNKVLLDRTWRREIRAEHLNKSPNETKWQRKRAISTSLIFISTWAKDVWRGQIVVKERR